MVIRESLNLSPGKIGAQCGHVMYRMLMRQFWEWGEKTQKLWDAWEAEMEQRPIVVLGANESEWESLKKLDLPGDIQVDAGLTEVAPRTETVMAFAPIWKSDRPPLLRRLRLYSGHVATQG